MLLEQELSTFIAHKTQQQHDTVLSMGFNIFKDVFVAGQNVDRALRTCVRLRSLHATVSVAEQLSFVDDRRTV